MLRRGISVTSSKLLQKHMLSAGSNGGLLMYHAR
jgi:hypothetical protein